MGGLRAVVGAVVDLVDEDVFAQRPAHPADVFEAVISSPPSRTMEVIRSAIEIDPQSSETWVAALAGTPFSSSWVLAEERVDAVISRWLIGFLLDRGANAVDHHGL